MKIARMLLATMMISGLGQIALGEELSQRDQLRAAVQEICPISGQKLGSMGTPIKVQVGQETVFVCCKGCLQKQISPQHWATVHGNIARAQRICPIMEMKLPKNPKWTFVEGQIVYVCCPPCTKKIVADPQTNLKAIDALYTASLQSKRSSR